MISHFDSNFLFNNFDEIQSLGTCQFCSSQMDHNMASHFWFAQNRNLRGVATSKNYGLQDLAFPWHTRHTLVSLLRILPLPQCFLIASQAPSWNLII